MDSKIEGINFLSENVDFLKRYISFKFVVLAGFLYVYIVYISFLILCKALYRNWDIVRVESLISR